MLTASIAACSSEPLRSFEEIGAIQNGERTTKVRIARIDEKPFLRLLVFCH